MAQRVHHGSSLRPGVPEEVAKRPLKSMTDDELYLYYEPRITYLGNAESGNCPGCSLCKPTSI